MLVLQDATPEVRIEDLLDRKRAGSNGNSGTETDGITGSIDGR
jgi:hypothetical protein